MPFHIHRDAHHARHRPDTYSHTHSCTYNTRRRRHVNACTLTPWRCSSSRQVLSTLFICSLVTTSLFLHVSSIFLSSSFTLIGLCEAKRQLSPPRSSRRPKTKSAGDKRSKKTAPIDTRVPSVEDGSSEMKIDKRSKGGTRTTGAGSRSTRHRSIFAPQLAPKALREATLSALSGDMRPSKESEVEGNPDLNRAASHIHAKLSRDGLFFHISRSKEDSLVVSLTARSDASSSSEASMIASLDQGRHIVNAEVIDIDESESIGAGQFRLDTDSSSGWIPIEGIYGIFSLPSGPHAVLITKSEEAYTSPTHRTADHKASSTPLLRFRRIVSMEIVHVPGKSIIDTSLSQRKSEERQLRLLRRSFREHDLYFVPLTGDVGNRNVVADVTHNLQGTFLAMSASDDLGRANGKKDSLNPTNDKSGQGDWWLSYLREDDAQGKSFQRPDSRFFWNEEHLKPLLQPYISSLRAHDGSGEEEDGQNPFALLLDCTFPVTSAFLGVQKRVGISAENAKTQKDTVHKVLYDELLISRRQKYRAGTRFTKRGADGTGAVTNYAETEQICLVMEQGEGRVETVQLHEVYSHVQTRGSIPLRWSSPADVKTYRPRVLIGTDPLAQARALRNHLHEQLRLYSIVPDKRSTNSITDATAKQPIKLSFVNLIDKHSDQGRLGRAFDSVLDAVLDVYADATDSPESGDGAEIGDGGDNASVLPKGGVEHVWFDFHAECKGGRWDKLENLLRDVSPVLDKQGYFCAAPITAIAATNNTHMNWQVLNMQDGVVRTNCMDCLDRTNVVQSIFGRYILYKQLQERLGLKGPKKRTLPLEYAVSYRRNPLTLPWSSGEVAHRLLWADNADAISRLYAGTPALKGDFTRTGKRTKRGALDDGINSLQRYYLNNFIDADRQEGMDLLVGHEGFTLVDDDDDGSEYAGSGSKDALRNLLLFGPNNVRSRSGRLEAGKMLRHSMGSSTSSAGGMRGNPLELDFNWLPGDLKSHMRSSAIFAEGKRSELLKSIDKRSSSDLPWWVGVDDSSDDEAQEQGKALTAASSSENSIVPSGGHLLGTLVAASQAPITTALGIVCVLWPGLISNAVQDDDDNVDSDD